ESRTLLRASTSRGRSSAPPWALASRSTLASLVICARLPKQPQRLREVRLAGLPAWAGGTDHNQPRDRWSPEFRSKAFEATRAGMVTRSRDVLAPCAALRTGRFSADGRIRPAGPQERRADGGPRRQSRRRRRAHRPVP